MFRYLEKRKLVIVSMDEYPYFQDFQKKQMWKGKLPELFRNNKMNFTLYLQNSLCSSAFCKNMNA